MKNGLLLVDKEAGITSHDAVDLFRRHSRIKKVGHTGTLDPLATGLLVLCVGKATRLQAFLMKMEKTYEGTIQFGWATDSYDAVGTPAGEKVEANLDAIDLDALAEPFRGEIDQMPPQFSAKKVQGVRAYELARRGESAALETKRVTVYELTLRRESASVLWFRVRCSAGTYVRSIAHDLGRATGVGAHLKTLVRTAIGSFRLEDAVPSVKIPSMPLETLLARPHFLGLDEVELPLPSVMVDRTQEGKLLRGQSVVLRPPTAQLREKDLVSVETVDHRLIAIGEISEVLREGGGPVVVQPKVVL